MQRGVLPLRRGYIPGLARFLQGENTSSWCEGEHLSAGSRRVCSRFLPALSPFAALLGWLPQVLIPDADPGMGPCHTSEGLVGRILHESVALTGEGGRAQ